MLTEEYVMTQGWWFGGVVFSDYNTHPVNPVKLIQDGILSFLTTILRFLRQADFLVYNLALCRR